MAPTRRGQGIRAAPARRAKGWRRRLGGPHRCVKPVGRKNDHGTKAQIRQRDVGRRFACEHSVQDQAEGVEVGPCRGVVTGELFRRHVRGRAGDDVWIVPFVRETREAEVGDAHATSPVDEHVGRFQIAVQDAAIMGRSQTRAELPREFERLLRWQSSNAPQKRGEIFAVHVLHREEVLAVGLADVVDTADVRMGHLARDADLVLEARQAVRRWATSLGRNLSATG